MLARTAALAAALVLFGAGCSAQVDDGSESPDAGMERPDPPAPDDDDRPEQPDPEGCAAGTHECGRECMADGPNTPETGCRLGCGEACPAPEGGEATCTPRGLCDFECAAGSSKDGDQCVSAACSEEWSCGSITGPDGELSCGECYDGATCNDEHQCDIEPDSQEPNDTQETAVFLGELESFPDSSAERLGLNIHAIDDEDWFTFRVYDDYQPGNPDIAVYLSGSEGVSGTDLGWLTTNHELTVWFQCDDGDEATEVTCYDWFSSEDSEVDDTLGPGCRIDGSWNIDAEIRPQCATTDDSGTVIVRVRKTWAPLGDHYNLQVYVD